jgi:hypothetical protein
MLRAVDSDTPLKVAFRVRTKDLLPLTDDAGAKVVSALAVELSAGRRTVDLVLRLRFGVVRLWEQSPERLLALGPGGAALVPLSAEASRPLVAQASRKIQRDAPAEQRPDLLAILQLFAEGRYTAIQLARVIPEEVTMASGLVEKVLLKGRSEGLAEGLAKGRARGRAEGARQICVQLAKALHPAVADRVVPVIERCSELTRLRQWALRAPRLSDVEFVRLVAGRGSAQTSRRRAPRPARRSSRTTKSSRAVR